MPAQVQPVTSANLPPPAGPYSPGIVYGGLILVSGQAGRDPATGRLAGDDIEAQTAQALKNIAAILEAAGSSLQPVLRYIAVKIASGFYDNGVRGLPSGS